MRICFYNLNLNNPVIDASFGGMYRSFWKAIELKGHEVIFSDSSSSLNADILVVPLGGLQEKSSSKAMAEFKGPVVTYVPPANSWFYKSFLNRWKHKIICAYGTDFSDLTFKRYSELQIPYYHIPFASDECIFKPLNLPKIYDIVFIGNANSGIGRYKYTNLLIETAKLKNWKILLIGSGWEKYDHPFQLVAHGELLNIIYNLSKICLNIHNDTQYKGFEYQMDANNRVFDLAMAGCFQIGNAEKLVSKYFDESEVIMIDDPVKWVERIGFYLDNKDLIPEISKKAREKALFKHTWNTRAQDFIDMINENKGRFNNETLRNNLFIQIARRLDQFFPPVYQLKQIRIIKKFLK
jgi:hypothetical protein